MLTTRIAQSEVGAPPASSPRRGLTVLEVLLSVAILFIAMTLLTQMMSLGSNLGMKAHAKEQALRFAQSKIAEVAGGAITLPANDSGTIDDTDLQWELTSTQRDDLANLWNVTVTVKPKEEDSSHVPFTLSQMVYDPSQRGSTIDIAINAANIKSANSQTSSSSSSSSNPSGSNQSSGGMAGPAGSAGSKNGNTNNKTTGGGMNTKTTPAKGAGTPANNTPSTAPSRTGSPSTPGPSSPGMSSSPPAGNSTPGTTNNAAGKGGKSG
jgi:hypothetical protein